MPQPSAMYEQIARDVTRAGNQTGLRDQNARLVLTYIRRHVALPSAEIARKSGLSAQTVSNIVRALEAEGLIERGEAIKGKVGKPSVPVTLNSSGVHSIGLNIGRRSAEVVLVDFLGKTLAEYGITYLFPTPDTVFPFLEKSVHAAVGKVPEARRTLAGVGVAMPFQLWDWHQVVGAPEEAMAAWRSVDVAAQVEAVTGFEPIIGNDATSACVAEHLLGHGQSFSDFVYLFIGAFVGGGLVLDGKVVTGRSGNTAAFGPLPVPDGKGGTTQLLNVASLYGLERLISKAGGDPERLRDAATDWSGFGDVLEGWIAETARNLAIASAAAASVVEIEAVIIAGAMPGWVTERLTAAVGSELEKLDMTGVEKPVILQAKSGRAARSIGAALLPIHARYFVA